nr:hypothetical protein [Bacilli bacterium]
MAANYKWTDDKVKILLDNYKNMPIESLSKMLETTRPTVIKKLEDLGVTYKARRNDWTEEELKELKLVSEDFTLDELAKRFNKSKSAVEHKVYRCKLKYKRDTHIKWDVHEINKLRLLAKDHHIDEIVPLFEGKSKSTILRKLKELNYDYVHHNMQMNEEQKQFIRDNYNTLSQPEIGLKIGVSVTTVRNFMKSEGLKKDIIKWTEEKIDELRELAKCNSIDVLANHFNTTEASIKSVAFKNNIKITTRRFIWNDELI